MSTDTDALRNGCEQALLLLGRERFQNDPECKVVAAVVRAALAPTRREEAAGVSTDTDALLSELERVKAAHDEAKKALWRDRGVMLDMQARLDKALAALRENEQALARQRGGGTPLTRNAYLRLRERTHAAIAEIEGEA